MSTKICFKCNEEKELSEYYKHKKMVDGHLNKCKSCTKKDTKDRVDILIQDENWKESEQTRHREKYHRLGYKEKHKQPIEKQLVRVRKYRNEYPEKYKAKNATQRIAKTNSKNELHHWSYNEEHYKDCIELSKKEHSLLHRFIIYDQSVKMYRTKDGILLDTKESHIQYFEFIKLTES
jgi:hypothetical protein